MLPLDLYLKLNSNTGTEYKDPDPDLVRKVGSGSGQKLIGSATLPTALKQKNMKQSLGIKIRAVDPDPHQHGSAFIFPPGSRSASSFNMRIRIQEGKYVNIK